MLSWIRKNWGLWYFITSFGILMFLWGLFSGLTDIFPHRLITDVFIAYNSFKIRQNLEQSKDKFLRQTELPGKGVTIFDEKAVFSGPTLMTMFRKNKFGLSLIGIQGDILHEWDIAFSEIWSKASHLDYQAPDKTITIDDSILFTNGDVVLSFSGESFPFGGGLVKINKDSKVIWSLAENTHHNLEVDSNGNLWCCAHKFHKNTISKFPNINPPFYEDFLLCISPDGIVVSRISMLEIIYANNYEGILFGNQSIVPVINIDDPLHLNDLEILPENKAKNFEFFRTGDIMVSFRNINTIAVLDSENYSIKWSMNGPFLRQHDPDFLPNGNILLFDNRMDEKGEKDFGGSRIIEINPVLHKIVWSYQEADDKNFYSGIWGRQQLLPNGNILITAPENGRIFELNKKSHNIVWEYVNKVKDDYVGVITKAERKAYAWFGSKPFYF